MTDPIQIGSGNRTVDRFMLYFQFGLVALFLIGSFFKIGWLFVAGVSLFLVLFHRERTMRRSYIYIQGDHFIIKHIVKPDVTIKKELYVGVSKPGSTSAFSSELSINFKDGRQFSFMAGDSRVSEVDKAIKLMI
jgi:hypothetical protein